MELTGLSAVPIGPFGNSEGVIERSSVLPYEPIVRCDWTHISFLLCLPSSVLREHLFHESTVSYTLSNHD